MTRKTGYYSYLLRLWQTRDGQTGVWNASLEAPGTNERYGFSSLDELFDFLRQQVVPEEDRPGDDAPGAPGADGYW